MSSALEDILVFSATAEELAITDQQLEILHQFREQVSSILKPNHDDYFLVRWLVARNFDKAKAEDMLRKHFEWRKEWEVDTILTEWDPPEVARKYYPGGFAGFDKEGSPIWIVMSANFDMKGMMLSMKTREFHRFIIWMMERFHKIMAEQSVKHGKKIYQTMFLNDLAGFSMSHILQPGMEQMPKMMQMVEANYPELMKVAMIINAPRVFPIMYNIMKPFMSEATKKKMKLYGKNYQEDLLQCVDKDDLPQHWGGNKVDENGDPKCGTIIPIGGTIPESYYLRGEDVVGDAEVTTVTIGRASHHDVSFTVGPQKKVLRWVFWSIHYDIKFGVYYRAKEGDKKKALLHGERINAHQVPVDGWVNCDKPGIYFVRFDNVYSWVHSKQIHHSMQLVDVEIDHDEVDQQALQHMDEIAQETSPEKQVKQKENEIEAEAVPMASSFGADVKFIDESSDEEEEEETRKRSEEVEAKKAEEVERKKAEEVERKKAEEVERKKAEEVERKNAEEVERKKAEEVERKKAEEVERKKAEEVERMKAEEVEAKKAEEVEAKKAEGVETKDEVETEEVQTKLRETNEVISEEVKTRKEVNAEEVETKETEEDNKIPEVEVDDKEHGGQEVADCDSTNAENGIINGEKVSKHDEKESNADTADSHKGNGSDENKNAVKDKNVDHENQQNENNSNNSETGHNEDIHNEVD